MAIKNGQKNLEKKTSIINFVYLSKLIIGLLN